MANVLLRFGVENHLSIRDRQELTLTAAKRVKRSGLAMPVPIVREAAVPVAALYGANASGKSNLVHAVRMMRGHVEQSHKAWDAADPLPRHPFLLDQVSANKPTRFDCMFTVGDQAATVSAGVYEYGFSYTDTEYADEWLHRIARNKRQTTQVLFHRTTADGHVQVSFGSRLRGENRAIASLTRPNSLFLSAAAQNNHAELGVVHRQFVEKWSPVRGTGIELQIAEAFARFKHQGAFMELMRQADLGVVGTELKDDDVPESEREKMRDILRAVARATGSTSEPDDLPLSRKRFRFSHTGAKGPHALDFDMESRGTRRLAGLAMPILNAIKSGQLVVVDELDASLHPRLTAALLRLFKNATNRCGAQLITTVHDTAPLHDELDLDEVWVAEKDAFGASRFTPLTDFRIRSREDLERIYRDGRVGGAPVIGDLTAAINE